MAQPKMDTMNLFVTLKYRDDNPTSTTEQLTTFARKQFPRDEFIASDKFMGWLNNGRGTYLEREMHKNLVGMVSLNRLAEESRQNLEDRDRMQVERDEARELVYDLKDQVNEVKVQLALMTPSPANEQPAPAYA